MSLGFSGAAITLDKKTKNDCNPRQLNLQRKQGDNMWVWAGRWIIAPAEWDVIPGRDRLSHSSSAASSLSQALKSVLAPCQVTLLPVSVGIDALLFVLSLQLLRMAFVCIFCLVRVSEKHFYCLFIAPVEYSDFSLSCLPTVSQFNGKESILISWLTVQKFHWSVLTAGMRTASFLLFCPKTWPDTNLHLKRAHQTP